MHNHNVVVVIMMLIKTFTSPNAALVQSLQDIDDFLLRQQVAEIGLGVKRI